MSLTAVQIYDFHIFTTVSCENAKERKAHVDKIALWSYDLRSQFYFLPVQSFQMKIKEGRNAVRWYPPIPICRMESDRVHGNPKEPIHVRRNHWSCGKPNLRQVQYKRNMPRS